MSANSTRQRTHEGQMFSQQAWDAGWAEAQARGLASPYPALTRLMGKADVEAIVSAVVNHGFEELYVEQVLPDFGPGTWEETLERLRQHMRDHIAIEALKNDCVMLTLPREVIDHPQPGMTRVRLIVPVRHL